MTLQLHTHPSMGTCLGADKAPALPPVFEQQATVAPWFLVGLSGCAGAGKDTAAAALITQGYTTMAVADAVRREVAWAFCCDETYFSDPRCKNKPAHHLATCKAFNYDFYAWAKAKGFDMNAPRSPRWLMQQWGDWRRQANPGYWLMLAHQRLANLLTQGHRRVVVTDLRTAGEAAWMQCLGGLVLRIHRPGQVALQGAEAGHGTEQLEGVQYDAWVTNDGSVAHLQRLVVHTVAEWFGAAQ